MKKFTVYFLIAILLTLGVSAQSIKSPDGQFELNFELNNGSAFYSLQYKGKPVIKPSKLGLVLVNAPSFLNGFSIADHVTSSFNETWTPVMGEQSKIVNNYNELLITLNQANEKRNMLVRFRLFNDGLGFRYEFPQQSTLNYFVIKEEESQFALAGDHKAWWIAGDYDTEEYSYTTSNLSSVPQLHAKSYDGNASQTIIPNGLQTPLMMKSSDGIYINIHEAALIGYAAMNVDLDATNFILKTHLTPDGLGNKGYIQTPFHTPWRTIVVSPNAEGILASKLILNLNEPTAYENTDWIKPVKYVGVWWQMFVPGQGSWAYADTNNIHLGITDYSKLKPNKTHAANNENVKKYIDFASKHGFDGVLVEGWNQGWEDWFGQSKEFVFDFVTPYPDFDVKMLTDYAREKGVRIIMHHETSSSATNYERWMDTAFRFMVNHGYNAVKTGYVGNIIPRGEHHYSQWMINHFNRVIEKAATYKIMVNSHESVHPTGLNRTYPNSIAAEAARGTEFETFGGINPDHQTILPFTRLMGGPMDYTPGIFQTKLDYYQQGDKRYIKTTLTKQLALYVTMYSPLQMAADLVENYERFPEPFQFIKDVAVDWDETKILSAEPGDHIAIARKAKGKEEWFIGGITDENPRTTTVNFSFLDSPEYYVATIYEDGKDAHYINNPQSYNIYKVIVNNRSKLNQKLAASGGFAISLKKATKEEVKKLKKLK
jgi:glucan 1,4-alpha-glucosidase